MAKLSGLGSWLQSENVIYLNHNPPWRLNRNQAWFIQVKVKVKNYR